VLDKDVSEEYLLANPHLYRESQAGRDMTAAKILAWIFRAAYQALVILATSLLLSVTISADGMIMDYYSASMLAYTALLIIQTITIAIETHNFTWINHIAVWGTLFLYFITVVIYNVIPAIEIYYVMLRLFSDKLFWLGIMLITVMAGAPIVATYYYQFQYQPWPHQIARKKELTKNKKGSQLLHRTGENAAEKDALLEID